VTKFHQFRAELHVHTVLSPCAEVEMIPPLIVQEAIDRGINILAITDHNATANIEAVIKAAKGSGLKILPGMELHTKEEVHVLCLFDDFKQAAALQEIVNTALPPIMNNPDFFGEQFVVDETGDFIRREDALLLTAVDITLKQAVDYVAGLGGLLIPAHVNRKAFGLIPALGFIPEELSGCSVMEISRHLKHENAKKDFPQLRGKELIQSGDVHRLNEFLGVNIFSILEPTISELKLAFAHSAGRSFEIAPTNL
jgi:hypothetical protein